MTITAHHTVRLELCGNVNFVYALSKMHHQFEAEVCKNPSFALDYN